MQFKKKEEEEESGHVLKPLIFSKESMSNKLKGTYKFVFISLL
jgi:hypothetical protein